MAFLNARLNAASESYPTFAPMLATWAPLWCRWREPKPCVYLLLPRTIRHNRPGSTRMGELAQGLWESLAGRYPLERELGRRGMALVYLDRGLKHDPYFRSPGWLRVDPTLDKLRTQPRFQMLVEGTT